MKRNKLIFTPILIVQSVWAMLIVLGTTLMLLFIGRNVLGEAVIALLYLVPVVWAASRWGQAAGMSAAVTAALCFNYFFIPPYYTFQVGSLEGWMVLIIFLAVAIIVVGRFQASLSRAREATFLYELSSTLIDAETPEVIASTVARFIQRLYQAYLVRVMFPCQGQAEKIVVLEPSQAGVESSPDRIVPVTIDSGLVGEIHIWRGAYLALPDGNSPLFQKAALLTARALKRSMRATSTDYAPIPVLDLPRN